MISIARGAPCVQSQPDLFLSILHRFHTQIRIKSRPQSGSHQPQALQRFPEQSRAGLS